MSYITDSVKDLIGKNVQFDFSFPYEDNSNIKCETSLIFGINPNGKLITGLVIKGQGKSIKFISTFKGQLFFLPSPFSSGVGQLHLIFSPLISLSLKTFLSEELVVPVKAVYQAADKKSVEIEIVKILQDQGWMGTEGQQILKDFMEGEVGVFVNSGQTIGFSQGDEFLLQFRSTDELVLNPIYLLWQLINIGKTENSAKNVDIKINPGNHSLITNLRLNNRSLTIADNEVYENNQDLGQYSFILP